MKVPVVIRSIFAEVFRFWSRATIISAFGLKEILVCIVLISLVRAAVDMVLNVGFLSYTVWFSVCLLWFFYIISLSVSTAFLLSRFIPKSDFKQALTVAVCVYWVIPFVPLFSLSPWEKAWGLGIFATIPFFRWIPTFLVEHNYLPLGMLVVSPVIIVMVSRWIAHTTGTPWRRAFVLTLAAFVLIYLYYYQWSWRVTGTALFDKGLAGWDAMLASFITYSFFSQIITFLLSLVIARSFREHPVWFYLVWSAFPLVLLLLIPRLGFFSLFLAAGHP